MNGIGTYAYQGINSALLSYGSSFNPTYTPGIQSFSQGSGIFGRNTAMASASTKAYIGDIKEFSGKLAAAAEKIVAGQPPVFSQMIAALSSSTPPVGAGSKVKSASVQVDQVAKAQTNNGIVLKSDAAAVQTGAQTFSIQSGGKSTAISVNISQTDNNKAAQQKIADAINKSNSGVRAEVLYNKDTKESSLILTGKETGAAKGFTLSDMYGGSLTANYGLNAVQTKAQDAVYSVDGKEYKSATNQIDLGGAAAEITQPGTFNIDLYRDSGSIKNAVADLVSSFNDMLDTAEAYGSNRLQSRLQNVFDSSAAALSKAGITMGFDGRLQIDEQKLNKAIEDGTLEKALGAKDGKLGFAGRLESIAEEANKNPASFAAAETGGGNTYNSFYDNSFGSSFKQYALNMQYSSIGQLFDALL